jgi:hypothetical protein
LLDQEYVNIAKKKAEEKAAKEAERVKIKEEKEQAKAKAAKEQVHGSDGKRGCSKGVRKGMQNDISIE